MYLIDLDHLIAEFPEDVEAIRRLSVFLRDAIASNPSSFECSGERLFDIASPSSMTSFSFIVIRLIESGILNKIIRVESDGMGGLAEFKSIIDVPDEIFDWRHDRMVSVRPDNIRMYYKFNQAIQK